MARLPRCMMALRLERMGAPIRGSWVIRRLLLAKCATMTSFWILSSTSRSRLARTSTRELQKGSPCTLRTFEVLLRSQYSTGDGWQQGKASAGREQPHSARDSTRDVVLSRDGVEALGSRTCQGRYIEYIMQVQQRLRLLVCFHRSPACTCEPYLRLSRLRPS